jgi:hypothetical protein
MGCIVVNVRTLLRPDGTTVPVEIRSKKMQDGNYQYIYRDITERRHTEAALRQQTEELRVRNDALTRSNQVAVGHERRMIELQREVNELCAKLGETPRYWIAENEPAPPAAPKTQNS